MTLPPLIAIDDLSAAQREAALTRGRDVAVTAGAGTGKTRTLVARFLSLLDDGLPLRSVVAVTFTRKAAREMRNRVRQEIAAYLDAHGHDPAAVRWQAIYNDLDAARIGTIHTLCGEIMRTHPAEAGIDPRFDVLDETQSALLLRDSAEAALGWAAVQPDMRPLFALQSEAALLKLIEELLKQRLVVAELVERIPAATIRDYWEDQIRTMQAEALARLLAHPDWQAAARTLHRLEPLRLDDKMVAQLLHVRAVLDTLTHSPLPEQLRDLAAIDEVNLRVGSAKVWPNGVDDKDDAKAALETLRDLYRAQPAFTATLNHLDDAVAAATPALYVLFAEATRFYDERKAERGALDFNDLEAGAIDLLAGLPEVAAYWQTQVRALLVDEFQDTNTGQRRLVRLLCPDPGKLFIVGDVKQSIYRFRGADVTVFAAEQAHIAAQDGRLLDLDTSYRAHTRLLEGMNRVLRPVLGDPDPGRPPWVAPFAPLRAGRDEVQDGLDEPFIALQLSIGKKDVSLPRSAAALAAELRALKARGAIDYGDVAILCRASGSFRAYEDALDDAGIPYVTVAGKGFYNRPEIRDLLNALTAIADPHDDLALVGLLRSPACGLSDETIYRLVGARPKGQSLWAMLPTATPDDPDEAGRLRAAVDLITALNAQAGRTSVAAVLKAFLDRTHYRAGLRRAGQGRALRNVSKLLLDVATSELVSISRFLEYAQSLRDSGSREGEARATGEGAVQIMSIHAAKGLEFPVVVLGDAARQGSPHRGALIHPELGILLSQRDDEEPKLRAATITLATAHNAELEQAESDRLLYVAMTRAEQLLWINGHVNENKSGTLKKDGWLRQLSEIIPFDDCDRVGFNDDGDAGHAYTLSLGGTPVGVTFYEPNCPPLDPADATPGAAPALPTELPLLRAFAGTAQTGPDSTPDHAWQVSAMGAGGHAPAWIVGQIVHEALALWRFPDDGFRRWAAARGREYGLIGDSQPDDAARRAEAMLARFRRDPLYREMADADRRLHEVPYSYLIDGRATTGNIDMLYRHNGRWTLVDFKTDYLGDTTPEAQLDQSDYRQQITGYGAAVRTLVGETPRLLVCFLNAPEGVAVRSVPA
jgi:ATP-dependent helicase/nuclease subunit A